MSTRPNILIFMTDQQQADVVAPDHPCLTPNADRLAREGVRFTQAYCPTAHCCPSRATFMTGLYPSRHGIFNNVRNEAAIHTGLRDGVVTFSEQLRDAGYDLTLCGKWHASAEEDPADRGWRERAVTAASGTYNGRSIEDWHKGTPKEDTSGDERSPGVVQRPGWGDFVVYKTLPDGGEKGYEDLHDYKVTRAAVETLHEYAESDEPWCVFVGPIGPHDPFNVPERFVRMYNEMMERGEIPLPPSYGDRMLDKPRVYQRQRRLWDQLSEDEVREAVRHYWAFCTLEDALLGEVLDALDETGQTDDTLVIFMSDHGDYVGAHGLFLKGVPAFREAYHVPCIVRWPNGLVEPGRTIDEFVSLADFAPTFLELAEIEVDEPSPRPPISRAPMPAFSGHSLVPFLQNEPPSTWRDAIHTQLNGVELYYTQRSVATRDHKYVFNGFDFDELYDLRHDPYETVNVASNPLYADVKHDLVRRMWRFAAQENDQIFNPYGTVALVPWGPADALVEQAGVYGMIEQLAKGEAAERQLDAHFADRFNITPATRDQQRQGIDRILTKRDPQDNLRRTYTIEYKTDWTAGRTKNAFIETISVDSMNIPGWAYSSQAQWLAYWVPPREQLCLIRLETLRRHLLDWIEQYGPEKAVPNDGYYTRGITVPLDEFARACERIEMLAEQNTK